MAQNHLARGITLAALVALTATACASGSAAKSANGNIVFDEYSAPAAAWATGTDDNLILSRAGCLETLLRYQPDSTVSENLATSWQQTTPTTWDFTLREGVKFQDGTPMNAEAVVGALQRVLDAKTPARSFNPSLISGVKAVDESTVQISTPAPDALLPLRLTAPTTGILAPKAYQANQIDIKGTCTGPFTVVQEAPGQSLKLERNEDYWGGKPKLATAEVRFVPDGATRVTQVQTGEAQIASTIPAVSRALLEGDSKIKLETLPSPRTTAMMLNNSRPPFNDPLVRQAIQRAIDLESIATRVYEGSAEPAVGPFSSQDAWAPKDAQPAAYDPEEAKRLLEKAGVDPQSLTFELIAYKERPEFANLAAVIQDQLGKLGIKVNIKAGDYGSVEPNLLSGNYDAALLNRGYLADLADPSAYLRADYSCNGKFNIAKYCDPQTDALINEAATMQDAPARYGQYAKIAERLQSDAVSAYLVNESYATAVSSDVQGFEMHPLNYYVLTANLSVG